jgi:hypothetical protein
MIRAVGWYALGSALLGLLIGVSVGLSESPIVAVLVPLLFALLSGGGGFYVAKASYTGDSSFGVLLAGIDWRLRQPRDRLTGQPQERQHSAAGRRDAGSTGPGAGFVRRTGAPPPRAGCRHSRSPIPALRHSPIRPFSYRTEPITPPQNRISAGAVESCSLTQNS